MDLKINRMQPVAIKELTDESHRTMIPARRMAFQNDVKISTTELLMEKH